MNGDPFQKFNIRWLSASSLNAFRSSQSVWCLQYLLGAKGGVSIPMVKGIAGEDGIAFALSGDRPLEEAHEVALTTFEAKTALGGFAPEAKEKARGELVGYETSRTSYPGIIANGIAALREYGPPSSHGEKINLSLADDLPALIGYKDFSYDHIGVDVDLKCTSRMPSAIPPDHALQGAIYWRASGNRAQRFCYVTPADFKVYELDVDVARNALQQAEHIARQIGELLSRSDDPVEVCRSTVPDFSNFRWSEETRAAATDVWDFTPTPK